MVISGEELLHPCPVFGDGLVGAYIFSLHNILAQAGQLLFQPGRQYCQSHDLDQAEVLLLDVVKYENLLPGREYVLKGTLVDKETKKAAEDADGKPITAQTAFTPTKKDGSAEVVFRFNGSRLAGETMVVFEELLCSGKLAAEHKDVKDEGQTVYFPSIETTATDKETGKGNSYAGQQVTIEDVVHYENLIPGKSCNRSI